MDNTELVKTHSEEELLQQLLTGGGAGISNDNDFYKLKPTTLVVNQGNTQVEGATPGKLRIVETGEQFDRLTVVLLNTPKLGRNWYVGEPGQLNRNPENLMCFARQPEKGQKWKPDVRSKMPQAVYCAGCSRNEDIQENWATYNASKQAKDKPGCGSQYYTMFVDVTTELPIRMYMRGTNKKNFDNDADGLTRNIHLLAKANRNPNLFDLQFDIYVEKKKNKSGQMIYGLRIDQQSIKAIPQELRVKMAKLYLQYTRSPEPVEESQVDVQLDEIGNTAQTINAEVETVNEQGEIVI